jgi:hypothetical protein
MLRYLSRYSVLVHIKSSIPSRPQETRFVIQHKILIIIRFILHFRSLNLGIELLHIDDSTDTITLLHCLESVVDLAESLAVGDELVDL